VATISAEEQQSQIVTAVIQFFATLEARTNG
jgi:hypothetical protein